MERAKKAQLNEIAEELNGHLIDVLNDFKDKQAEVLGVQDIMYVCLIAIINVLSTVAFTKLSKTGIENSDGILASIVDSVRMAGEEAIEDRREELESGVDVDEDLDRPPDEDVDPWR